MTDYKHLVERLREDSRFDHGIYKESADAIESLTAELAKYRDAPVVAFIFDDKEALMPSEVEKATKAEYPELYKPLIIKPTE